MAASRTDTITLSGTRMDRLVLLLRVAIQHAGRARAAEEGTPLEDVLLELEDDLRERLAALGGGLDDEAADAEQRGDVALRRQVNRPQHRAA